MPCGRYLTPNDFTSFYASQADVRFSSRYDASLIMMSRMPSSLLTSSNHASLHYMCQSRWSETKKKFWNMPLLMIHSISKNNRPCFTHPVCDLCLMVLYTNYASKIDAQWVISYHIGLNQLWSQPSNVSLQRMMGHHPERIEQRQLLLHLSTVSRTWQHLRLSCLVIAFPKADALPML